MDEILKSLIEGCKEEGLSLAQALSFLPAAIIAEGQRSPESGLLSEPMDALLKKVKDLW